MAGRHPEDTVRWAVSEQRWSAMTFLHWPLEPATVAALLPDGLEVDTWEGAGWVSVTPFLMEDFRLASLPPAGPLSTFPETNVRTYVRGPSGRDGLWFLSLDADSLPTVVAASTLYGVPYRWAAMTLQQQDDLVVYRSRRRMGRPAGHDIRARPGGPREPSGLDDWLTGRWRAYSRLAGRLAVVSVEHEPWPLRDVEVIDLEQTLLEAGGLPPPTEAPLAQYSPGVSVRLGPPRPV